MELSPNHEHPRLSKTQYGRQSLAIGAIVLAATLWGLSLTLPVWETRSTTGEWDVVRGALPALIGWLGVFEWCPAWFANLLLIPVCITLLARRFQGFWLSVAAFVIAATAYGMHTLYGDNSEAIIVGRRIGFYLWLASFGVMVLAHGVLATNADRSAARGARFAAVVIIAFGVVVLERVRQVGVTPLEASLKDSGDMSAFTTALARHPSQTEKDAALRWVVLADVSSPHRSGAIRTQRLAQLIAAGANVNQPDRYGDTPLMEAVRTHGAEPAVRLLIGAGANVNARDYRGKTVLDIAEERDSSPECRQILVDAGAVKSSRTPRN